MVGAVVILSGSLGGWKRELVSNSCGNPNLSQEFLPGETAYWMGENLGGTQAVSSGGETVLGRADESKWVEVDLSEQKLLAHQGDQIVLQTKISSGKFNRTPTGEFRVWIKLKYTKMEGGVKGTRSYYYLPNVPYTMFFYNEKVPKWKGFGLHGTYWHNNFGTPMSHGCVNLPTDMASQLFAFTDPQVLPGKGVAKSAEYTDGTRVVIHE